MKACVLRASARVETNPLEFRDVPTPEPAKGEVLVRVSCAPFAARICTLSRANCRRANHRSSRGTRSLASWKRLAKMRSASN